MHAQTGDRGLNYTFISKDDNAIRTFVLLLLLSPSFCQAVVIDPSTNFLSIIAFSFPLFEFVWS